MNKALFLDLDHTLIRPKSGATFPKHSEDWEFLPGMLEAIKPYFEEGFMMIIVSNQGGIEAGHHSFGEISMKLFEIVRAIEAHHGLLADPNARTDAFFCPSMNPEHENRKPNPGMILAAKDFYQLDLSLCLMVGDMESDRLCAERAGVSFMDVNEFLRTHA
jgi:D-glycero-D-manno-heptose 1,7-bisphosphate phosphatase